VDDFTILGETTHADHFGTESADIRIRVIPEIRIRIADQLLALAESAPFEHRLSCLEWRINIKYAYNFWKCADAVYPKLSKSVHA